MELTEKEKVKLMNDLKALHYQCIDFVSGVRNGSVEKHYKEETMEEFEKLNELLGEYIQDVDYGLEADKSLEDWCDILAETLLDDDNFYIDEDGFEW